MYKTFILTMTHQRAEAETICSFENERQPNSCHIEETVRGFPQWQPVFVVYKRVQVLDETTPS